MLNTLFVSFGLLLSSCSITLAENYNFYLHNKSDGWVINGFYTYQNGRWSSNWLKGRVTSGRSVPMRWDSQAGACEVPFRVSWSEWGAQDFSMDWCANVPTNIYMLDNGFKWD